MTITGEPKVALCVCTEDSLRWEAGTNEHRTPTILQYEALKTL